MTRLDRYLARQFLGPFILAVMGFVIIGAVDIIFYLVEMTVVSQISWILLAKLLVYKLPGVMVLFFPMAVLFSVMTNLIRMNKDQEITIFIASGISRLRLMIPWVVFAFGISGLAFLFNNHIVPVANRAFELTVQKQIQHNAFPQVMEKIVFRIGNRFIYVHHANPHTKTLDNLVVIEPTQTFPQITTAQKATWTLSKWTLLNGQSYQLDATGTPQFFHQFAQLDIAINPALFNGYTPERSASEMSAKELKAHIIASQKSGRETTPLKVEYYLKFSLPLACTIFGIMGMLFSQLLGFNRNGWSIIIAIALGLCSSGFYFFLIAFTRAFAKNGSLPPLAGAWLPNLIYLGICLLFLSYLRLRKA